MSAMFNPLSEQPLPARRRFVVLATALSFTLIVLVWLGTLWLGKKPGPSPSASPAIASPTPDQSEVSSPTPEGSPDSAVPPRTAPSAPGSSNLDVGQISTSLLKVFGSPKPTSSPGNR